MYRPKWAKWEAESKNTCFPVKAAKSGSNWLNLTISLTKSVANR